MPHLNDLVRSVDAQKFTFIAVDDEPEDIVTSFLRKRPMASMVALDDTGATFRAFKVSSRPTTIVIDPRGNIALVTKAEDLTISKLKAIASGNAVREPSDHGTLQATLKSSGHVGPEELTHREDSRQSLKAEEPLAEISLRRKLPAERMFSVLHEGESESLIGWSSRSLIAIALNASERDIKFEDEPPAGSVDLIMRTGTLDEHVRQELLKAIVMKGFKMTMTKTLAPADALVLTRSDELPLRLQPTINEHVSASMQSDGGRSHFVNFTGDGIAAAIAQKYGVHVVNETGLKGGYDGAIQWPAQLDGLSPALRSSIGLDIAHEVRDIATFVVSTDASGHAGVEAQP